MHQRQVAFRNFSFRNYLAVRAIALKVSTSHANPLIQQLSGSSGARTQRFVDDLLWFSADDTHQNTKRGGGNKSPHPLSGLQFFEKTLGSAIG